MIHAGPLKPATSRAYTDHAVRPINSTEIVGVRQVDSLTGVGGTAARLRLQLRQHRRVAGRYVARGWPIAAGSWWDGHRYRCDLASCKVEGLHGVGHGDPAATSAEDLAGWPARPYTLLLLTGLGVDVLELPARAGTAVAATRSRVRVPVARTPTGRWLLFVATGGLSDEAAEAARASGVLHHGAGSHVPLPPSRLAHGRVQWITRPDSDDLDLPSAAGLLEWVLPLLPTPATDLALTSRDAR